MRIRTQSLVGEYVHIDRDDPAIDRSVDGWEKRYDTAIESGDLSLLPLKNGATEPPAIWRFRHLTMRESAWLNDASTRMVGNVEMLWQAVALALVGVTNVQDELGRPVEVRRVKNMFLNGWHVVEEDQLNALLADEQGRPDPGLTMRLGLRVLADQTPRRG